MKKILILIAILCCVCCLAACQPAAAPPAQDQEPEQAQDQEPEPAAEAVDVAAPASSYPAVPAFATEDIYGNKVDESIFAGYELTMLNIWGTYCGPCIMEMPYLGQMAAEMPEGTQLVGLVADAVNSDYIALAQEIVASTEADYLHLALNKSLYEYLYENLVGVPTTLFIDAEGNVVGKELVGAQPMLVYEAELKQRLEQIRAEAADEPADQPATQGGLL